MSEQTEVVTMRSVILEAVNNAGDIESNRELIKTLASSVSDHLLTVAKGIPVSEGDEKAKLFVAACEVEETFIKSDEAGINKVDKLPRCWINPKSNIKAAYELGLDLHQFKSESELRKKVTELRKAKKEEEDKKEKEDNVSIIPEDIIEIDPRLSQSVAALLTTVKDLKGNDGKVEAIIEVLNMANTKAKEVLGILVPVEPKKVVSKKKVVAKKKVA